MELSKADKIWNRAALESGGEHPLEGDRALADLLFFDGMAANGGLGHAFDVLSEDEVTAAINGFRYFGFHELAQFLETVADMPEEEQEQLSAKYYERSDAQLVDSFKTVLLSRPESFAPLDDTNPP